MTTLSRPTGYEFRSKEQINGWPIVHINIGVDPETGQPLVAKGVVAIGNIAFGIVSIGVAAFGAVALGVFGLGIVSLASMAIGIISLGAVALAYEYALGVGVLSAKSAFGVIGIDFQFLAWLLIITASIAAGIWILRKVKTDRLQS